MTEPAKLCALLLQSPNRSVDFRDFLAMLEAFGFVHVRPKSSHRSYAHPECLAILVVQPKGKDAKRYQVREFLDIVEECGPYWMTDATPLPHQRVLGR
ncbi:MAG: type II toxin-antitoxin system HicA family toxin [Alphaproteobacteria bacterium]|nr:type II toxin-antitoxin system HicA family toxin [Alphaproteobacteria bacterium]